VVTIEGEEVRARLPEGAESSIKISELFERAHPAAPNSLGAVLPDGVKSLLPHPTGYTLVHQTPPRVYSFRWIAQDSPEEFGPGTNYRQVRLALPYLVVLAVFEGVRGGVPRLGNRNECFFLNQPLDIDGLDTELCYPALLNCSRYPDSPVHPLAWICTQYLSRRQAGRIRTFEEALRRGLQALLRHLLESGFNRSSEHHELNSWFSETVAAKVDPRIASVEDWEAATAEDPLFVLEVPWLTTGLSLRKIVDRIAAASERRAPRLTCADDVARVVFQGQARKEKRA
jgi:hypothetical protein